MAGLNTLAASPQRVYELPGAAVFPESVGVDPATGDAYVGSLADGALYRLRADGAAELWSAAGSDGRGSVAGVKVDSTGRLWAAGGYEGTLFVYAVATGALIARFDIGSRPSCVNDIAFAPDGAAYVTDSFISMLFRVTGGAGEPLALEPWIDLSEQGVPWASGLNFNGIVLSPDGSALVACQTNLGRLWQIDIASAQVREVALSGGPLEHCDGLALAGSTLYVAINAHNRIALVDLGADGSTGALTAMLAGDAFAFPTAVARHGDRLLVVNGQLDRMTGTPVLPFTVVELDAAALR
jgi:Cu-Zn family superoxide dismutase